MKNDLLLFAVLFAVAWIGFANLKGYIEPALAIPDPQPSTTAASPIDEAPSGATPAAPTDINQGSNPSESKTDQGSVERTNESEIQIDRSRTMDSDRSDSIILDTDAEQQTTESAKTLRSSPQSPEEAIQQVLMAQVESWNGGDLDGFMQAYWNDEALTFSGGGETTIGFKATYDKYRQQFPEGEMGQIEFKDLNTDMVGDESAIVTGRFNHELPDDSISGTFSLVLKKFDNRWKIIHDHTSIAE